MLSFTFQYGSIWRRAIALAIDLAILAIAAVFLFDPVVITLGHESAKQASIHAPFSVVILRGYTVWLITIVVGAWLYFSFMESSQRQATIGKRVMGLLVVARGERRLSFRRASLRFCVKGISILTGFLGFFIAFFDQKSRMLHDRVSGSLVLEARNEMLQ